jgi:ligand-binding sensor domain-containing protein
MNIKIRLLLICFILAVSYNALFSDDFWWKTNGPYGADITKVLVDQRNNVTYITTKSDGIYRSNDGGQYWISFNEGALKQSNWVNDMLIDTVDNIFYCVTDSAGIFKKQGASSWSQKLSGFTLSPISSIYKLQNGNLLIGTYSNQATGLYTSSNKGDSWGKISGGVLSASERIYCITQAKDGEIILGVDNGVIIGTANADNWPLKGQNITGTVYALKKSADGNTIMAGTSNGPYYSTNKGSNWIPTNSGMPANSKVISLSFHKDGYFIAGTEKSGLYISNKTYTSWYPFNQGFETKKIQALATNAKGEIFAGTNFSFYYLKDTLQKVWEPRIKNLGLRTVNGFAMLAARGTVLAATDLGIYRTINNGTSWEQLNQGLNFLDVNALAITKSGYILAGTNGDGLYYSNNQGEFWNKLDDGVLSAATIITTLDTSNVGNVVFAGTKNNGVFRSLDINGTTWLQMEDFDNVDKLSEKDVISFLVSNEEYAFAGTSRGLFRKDPSTNKWQIIFDNGQYITKSISYYSMAYYNNKQTSDKYVFIAHDNGLHYTLSNGGGFSPCPSVGDKIKALIIGDNGHIYISKSQQLGVYRSTENGANFQILPENTLNNLTTKSLDISGRGFIYAGTIGGGVFRSLKSTSTEVLSLKFAEDSLVIAQQGQKVEYNITSILGDSEIKPGVEIKVTNDMDVSFNTALTTNAQGKTKLTIDIPSDLPDGKYSFYFVGALDPYLDSDLMQMVIDVKKQSIKLDVQPVNLPPRDWTQPVNITITAKDINNNLLDNIKIEIDNKLLPEKISKNTVNGVVNYSFDIPDNHLEKDYDIYFWATDPNSYYQPSDTIKRQVTVSHNDIVIDGDIMVCENENYVYKSVADANKRYTWSCVGGTINGSKILDTVNITWGNSGNGSLTLQQEIISPPNTTSRQLDITINPKDPVTADSLYPQCENVPYNLSDITVSPKGGEWTGPNQSVVNNIFYGELAGTGTQTLRYSVTNSFGCVSYTDKKILVKAKPNVTFTFTQTTICKSEFPITLPGTLANVNPIGGMFEGPGITNNQFSPKDAGVGTHSITYTYQEPTTGCENYVVRNIEVLDAPDVILKISNFNICASQSAFLLDPIVDVNCDFSGNYVNVANRTFDATKGTVGETVTVTYITKATNANGCKGKGKVDFKIVDVPDTPTIGIRSDAVTLFSSSDTGNQWYDDNGPITGKTEKEFKPSKSGNYRVSVIDSITGCESYLSDSLFYPSKSVVGTVSIDKYPDEVEPGKIVNFKIKINNTADLKTNGIDQITATLVFNGTLLYPMNIPTDKHIWDKTNKSRTIIIDKSFSTIDNSLEIASIDFTTMVGNAISTNLTLDDLKLFRDAELIESSAIIIDTGFIAIKVPSRGDGPRLYDSWNEHPDKPLIKLNPNPADETVEIEVITNSDEWINIELTDLNGQVLKTIYKGVYDSNIYSGIMNTNTLLPGVYFVILQTPWQKKATQLYIIR